MFRHLLIDDINKNIIISSYTAMIENGHGIISILGGFLENTHLFDSIKKSFWLIGNCLISKICCLKNISFHKQCLDVCKQKQEDN